MKGNYDKAAEALRAEIRASKKAKILRFLVGPYRSGLNAGWKLLIWIITMSGWLLLPCVGVIFAGAIVESIDISTTTGQYAAIAAYIVGIVAGCRAAYEAGQGIKQQYGGIRW